MKICLINTYSGGGAGIACRRLQQALNNNGATAKLLSTVEAGNRWPFYAERLSFLPYEANKSVRFSFSLANFGKDLRQHAYVREADVLHLHWINQGLLSLKNIRQLAELGKPIVWTLHDMWAFTGGCHYSQGCDHYLKNCGNCLYLRRPAANDLSNQIWQQKQKNYPAGIQFVTCSDWLKQVADSSALLQPFDIQSIPNPIDTALFKPTETSERLAYRSNLGVSADTFLLAFVAMKVSETRKGFHFLKAALELVKKQRPDLKLEILVLGRTDDAALATLPYKTHPLGLVMDPHAIAHAYGASDAFIIPSLEDNLPNTVMESLACGTPVIGFETGGIPQMTGHMEQGYIAQQGDSQGLADGINWVANLADRPVLRMAAREKVTVCYREEVVADRYIELYRRLLKNA